MSSFTSASGFRRSGNNLKPWEVTEDFKWYFDSGDGVSTSEDTVIVPEGFQFNGADIPLPVCLIWPKVHHDYMQAAALHDYLLDDLRADLTRHVIDWQFYTSLKVLGNSNLKSWLMYQAVKRYGQLVDGKYYYQKLKLVNGEYIKN